MGTLCFVPNGGSGGAGTGDVVGPASATDNAVARYDGPTGKLIQNSVMTVSDTGEIQINGAPLTLGSSTPGDSSSIVTGDNPGGDAGDVIVQPGDSTAGAGGSTIIGGGGGSTDGGDVVLDGGDGTAGDGGDVVIQPGEGGTSDGEICFVSANGAARVCITVDPTTVDYSLVLPLAQGAASSTLQNDGSGNLSWVAGGAAAPFVGDSGAGGAQGLVPAPAAGDAAAGKFLFAGGTWAQITQADIVPNFEIASYTKTAPNGGQTLYERGDTLIGTDIAATYISGPPDTGTINNSLGGSVGGGDVNPAAWTFVAPFATGSQPANVKRDGTDNAGAGASSDPTWTFELDVDKGAINDTASITVRWTRRVFYGADPNAGPLIEAEIEALANTPLGTARARSFTLSPANEYVYYAYPADYDFGLAAPSVTADGFPAAFDAPYTVSVTNVNGLTSVYNVYRSSNLLNDTFLFVWS